jgi:hypothetical protein
MKVVGAVVALLFAWVAAVVWRARPAASSAVSV